VGSRFLPTSRAVPKELLPLGVRPLIHHALDEVERAGFTEAAIVVSPEKDAIRRYFEPAPDLERLLRDRGDREGLAALQGAAAIARRLRLRFVEQAYPSGMGHAVARCRSLAGSEPFAVLTPDDVITGSEHWTRLREIHTATGAPCLTVRPVPPQLAHRFGIAACTPGPHGSLRVERLVEKPALGQAPSNLAVLGRYIVTPAVLDAVDAIRRASLGPEVQLTNALAAVIPLGPGVLAVPFLGQLFDSGTPGEYARSLARYAGIV
jgi:UTP--glucose-1-phosphate uridylyltransferase